MPDPTAVQSALIGKLLGDATLASLLPDGVYRDVATHGKTRFVIVSKTTDGREYMQPGPITYDDLTFLVKAVEKSKSDVNTVSAASRIYVLLHNQPLSVSGYSTLRVSLAEENATIAYQEPDDDNADDRWQHVGWQFSIMVAA